MCFAAMVGDLDMDQWHSEEFPALSIALLVIFVVSCILLLVSVLTLALVTHLSC